MHAVLVTFHSTVSLADVGPAFIDHARALGAVPGMAYATWIHAGARIGTFNVFSDRHIAEQYLGSDLFRQTKSNAAFSDFEIRHFDVMDSLSELSGTTRAPRAHG